jgi:calcyclin binding protein
MSSFTFHKSDIDELNNLLKVSQRPNVQNFLKKEIDRLTALESQNKTKVPGLNLSSQLSKKSETKSTKQSAQPIKPTRPPAAIPGAKYVVPPSFGWDQKGDWVTISIRDLPGVGSLDKSKVSCDFTSDSFDLCIHDLDGKNYRVLRDNLDKDIIPGESKLKIKSNKVYIKLKKVPGEYGADHWTNLTSKKSKKEKKSQAKSKKDDPMGGIMDLMKDMYDTGDEKMKETIGKAMYESRMGKKNISDPSDPTGGIGGGMGDMNDIPGL